MDCEVSWFHLFQRQRFCSFFLFFSPSSPHFFTGSLLLSLGFLWFGQYVFLPVRGSVNGTAFPPWVFSGFSLSHGRNASGFSLSHGWNASLQFFDSTNSFHLG